jgi:hypothetical protein
MRVQFVERESRPERLVCEAEIHFEEDQLAGTRLVGFSLWRSPEGEIFVTFPSRALAVGSDRKYFDYLRAVNGDAETVKRVKAWILDEYRKVQAAA